MKVNLITAVAFAMLTASASGALAQNVTFVSKLGPPTLVGGVGPDAAGGGGYWTSTSIVKTEGRGESNSTSLCVAMNQPTGSIYDRHLTCTSKSEGGELGIIMGCMKGAKDSGEMTCSGFVDGKSGEAEGHGGVVTQHFKFNLDGSGGTATGTGQWTR